MGARLLVRGAMVVLCGSIGWTSRSMAEDRPAEKILAEIRAIQIPQSEPKDRDLEIKKQKLVEQRARLILELYKAHPYHAELVRLMPERWQSRPQTPASAVATRAEVEQVLAKSKNPKLVTEAAYFKALLAIRKGGANPKLDVLLPAVDEFTRKNPADPRGAALLFLAANDSIDKEKKAAVFDRIKKEYPDSTYARQVEMRSDGPRNQEEMVGKPFALEFTEAIKGSQVSMASLKGKVVVVDFWATWCGPCIAEMPKMKKLYAQYKDKGVEFVGVSLDQPRKEGGLDALKKYVAENQIEWPQYYQGNGWESDFSSSWGVNSIPCVFLIDAEGNLATVKARGRLEALIPEYLEKGWSKGSIKSASAAR